MALFGCFGCKSRKKKKFTSRLKAQLLDDGKCKQEEDQCKRTVHYEESDESDTDANENNNQIINTQKEFECTRKYTTGNTSDDGSSQKQESDSNPEVICKHDAIVQNTEDTGANEKFERLLKGDTTNQTERSDNGGQGSEHTRDNEQQVGLVDRIRLYFVGPSPNDETMTESKVDDNSNLIPSKNEYQKQNPSANQIGVEVGLVKSRSFHEQSSNGKNVKENTHGKPINIRANGNGSSSEADCEVFLPSNDRMLRREEQMKTIKLKYNVGENEEVIKKKVAKYMIENERLVHVSNKSLNRLTVGHHEEENQLGRGRSARSVGNISQMQQILAERGEKVELLDVKTRAMADACSTLSTSMSNLAEKYKNKKWYEL